MNGDVMFGSGVVSAGDIEAIARGMARVALAPAAVQLIGVGYGALEAAVGRGGAVYGVTTGLGAAADTRVVADGETRQLGIVLARSVGVGPLAPVEIVRATMAARLAGLSAGRSGASPGAVAALVAMLNRRVHPCMPMDGSVGEADLAPLAHVAAVLMGAGEAEYEGRVMPGGEALALAGLAVPALGIKDGLALVAANALSTGHGALVVQDGAQALAAASCAAALSCAGFGANTAPLDPRAAALRPGPGQGEAAARLLGLLAGCEGLGRRLQDPLSVRCLAPVLGCADSALAVARDAVALELNSAGDNPAILAEDAEVVGTANFDVTHLVAAFEGLGLALARLAALAGARVMQMMSPGASGLPRFLSAVQGGSSGFSAVQKSVSALVARIQHQAAPLPVMLLAVADGVEDYAAMAPACVAKTGMVVSQFRLIVAIELMVAAQACDLRGVAIGPRLEAIHAIVRGAVSRLGEDRATAPDIAAQDGLIRGGVFGI